MFRRNQLIWHFLSGILSKLYLQKIPPTGYISPEVMVASLAALPRLKILVIEFQSATPRPDRTQEAGTFLPSVTRTDLPLTVFRFKGASEYLEDLVTRIDCPLLYWIGIEYFNQFVDFRVNQLSEFIDRPVVLRVSLTLLRHARVTFSSNKVTFHHSPPSHAGANPPFPYDPASTVVLCEGIDWQVSHMAQVLSQLSATLSNVVHLELEVKLGEGRQLKDTDDVEWLLLLHQFSAVQTLHISQELAGHIALALEGSTRGVFTEVLPSLDLICLAGQPASSVEKFVAARHLSDRPVTVVDTKRFDEMLKTYDEDQEEDSDDSDSD
jgi:hypothetical protein